MEQSGGRRRALWAGAVMSVLAAGAWAQATTFRFDLARQPLADAIIRVSRIIGANVLFESGLLAGHEAPLLRGDLTAEQALDRLLSGTGLVARRTDGRSFFIQRQPADTAAGPPPAVVAGRAPVRDSPLPPSPVVIEEVLVTAQRREEALQGLPVVIQVMSDALLQRAGVRDFTTINKVASNIQVVQGAGAPIVAIRGVRANAFGAASESPVAVHLDGNYISQAVSLTGMLFDLERVEVLAGPQGTLFGRNAAAGIINIITRKPGPEFAAGAEVELGSDRLFRTSGVLNTPLGGNIALRVAAQALDRDGYFANGLDDARQRSARVGLSFVSGGRSRWLFTADHSQNRPRGSADNLVVAGEPGNGLEVPPVRDNSPLYGPALRAEKEQTFRGAALQFDHELGFGTFTVQASHRDVHQADRVYGAQNLTRPVESGRSSTIEARVASPSGGEWEYTGGLYFFTEDKRGGTGTYADLDSDVLLSEIRILGQETTAWAAFGQATWTPVERVHLTLGLRLNDDRKLASSLVLAPPDSRFEQLPERGRWSRLGGKGSIAFELTADNMLFASLATGYKSGTFAYGPTPRVDPQDVVAWELGTKNRFLGGRLQLNVNAYHSDYDRFEQPYTTPIPGTTLFLVSVTNTGGAIVRGADLELDWKLSAADRLRARVNYLDTAYRGFDLTAFGGLDYSGLPLVNTPRWAVNAGYTRVLAVPWGSLDLSVDAQYRSARGISSAGSYDARGEPFIQDAHTLVDLGFRFLPSGSRWSLTGYVSNLLDEVHFTQANYNVQQGYNVYAQLAAPRTWGVILGFDF